MSDADILRRLAALERLAREPQGERPIIRATSFPTGVPAGFAVFRSDLGWLCYYDGTRWLTTHEASIDTPVVAAVAASTQVGLVPVRSDYELWVTRVAQWYFVATTNNATNFWTITLRSVNGSYGGGSTVHTFNTSARAANTWYVEDGAPSVTNNPVENNGFDINLVTTLAPGTLRLGMTVFYRLIVP